MKGMNHEPKSASIGMLSTATRTTATVSPLTPSPINGSLVPNGSPAASSALSVQSAPSSSFAAALRKLAKQAEEPRGSSISSESSPVSSPATNHSSPASTPKRGPMGPIIVPSAGHTVPNTPPVVTIAPTKTVNGVWRSEARQQSDGASRASSFSRERMIAESQLPPEKAGTPSVPAHLLGNTYAFAIPPSSVVQDSRFQPLNLQRQVHHVVPPSAVTEEYLRSFRPYHTAEDLRMPSIPHLGLDPTAAAAYYHNTYLAAHHPFQHPAFRMDDSYCLSALRSPFYPLHSPGSLPPLHPSAMHLHLSGVRYPADLAHSSLSALQSERISSLTAERLQMDEELRQREREREQEREKEREADREREKEREREREREREKKELEREKEREKERERELERQRERAREKEANLMKNLESQFLAESELHPLRSHQEERVKPPEPPPPSRPEKLKESSLQTPKPVQHSLHQPPPTTHHSVPSLISTHAAFPQPTTAMAAALLAQRTQEEEKWLARQRRLRQEKEDRQYQVSEFRQQVLEQQLDASGHPIPNQSEPEIRPENLRVINNRNECAVREPIQHFGGPPPLISPKPQQPTPTSLWNPVSLMETPAEPRRTQEPIAVHNHATPMYEHNRPTVAQIKIERPYSFEKPQHDEEEMAQRRRDLTEKYLPIRDSSTLEHAGYSHAPFLAELEKSTQSFLNQQRSSLHQAGQTAEITLLHKPSTTHRAPPQRTREPMYIYDEFLQQHRRLVSKLDLEERRRKEAREKGYYYDLDDSYDESDEEEVRAHLRRVAEQPPLKLDTSSEKLEFLQIFGLTTQQEKARLLQQKRRKRRRMLRERSQSPPTIQTKRQTPSPHSPLSTRFSPDELNNSPNLEEKKKFLTIFDLSHVSAERRRDKEKLVEMLEAIKQKNAAPEAVKTQPAPPTRISPPPPPPPPPPSGPAPEDQPPAPPSKQPDPPAPVASTSCTVSVPEPIKPPEPLRLDHPKLLDSARVPPLPLPVQPPATDAPSADKMRPVEAPPPAKKSLSILNFVRGHPPKENPVQPAQSMNGRNKSWEPFLAEEFAHQFHESVLQSTQKALQKHKGASGMHIAEKIHKPDASVHYNIPELKHSSRAPAQQQNGQPGPGHPGASLGQRPQDVTSGEETSEEEEEEDEEEDEPPRPKWQGIEAILEAYQEHMEEQNIERHVLETQCKRLEAQHYNLSLTAEQLSHRMADLMSQKQRISSERDRLQAELEHFRKCLVLPSSSWSRGYFKGHPR